MKWVFLIVYWGIAANNIFILSVGMYMRFQLVLEFSTSLIPDLDSNYFVGAGED